METQTWTLGERKLSIQEHRLNSLGSNRLIPDTAAEKSTSSGSSKVPFSMIICGGTAFIRIVFLCSSCSCSISLFFWGAGTSAGTSGNYRIVCAMKHRWGEYCTLVKGRKILICLSVRKQHVLGKKKREVVKPRRGRCLLISWDNLNSCTLFTCAWNQSRLVARSLFCSFFSNLWQMVDGQRGQEDAGQTRRPCQQMHREAAEKLRARLFIFPARHLRQPFLLEKKHLKSHQRHSWQQLNGDLCVCFLALRGASCATDAEMV